MPASVAMYSTWSSPRNPSPSTRTPARKCPDSYRSSSMPSDRRTGDERPSAPMTRRPASAIGSPSTTGLHEPIVGQDDVRGPAVDDGTGLLGGIQQPWQATGWRTANGPGRCGSSSWKVRPSASATAGSMDSS